jgi:hypothetical protein
MVKVRRPQKSLKMVKVTRPLWTPCHHPHLALAINAVPRATPTPLRCRLHHALLFVGVASNSMQPTTPTTPAISAIAGAADTSPLTMVNAAPATDKQGNVSPAGGTGTAHFLAGGSESGGEEQILGAIVAELESVPKTPTKTVLPEEYDASSGNTPPGFEGTWRETNARCGTDRPFVPGHTSSPRVRPGPFYVDTPPSKK